MELSSMNIKDFVELLGSNAPAPGGGGAAALTGAIGAALSQMVLSFTVDSKKYAKYREDTLKYIEKVKDLEGKLLEGMDKDAEAYLQVSAAYKLPKESEEDKEKRSQAIQDALYICIKPPIELMELGLEALELTEKLVGKTNKSVFSDLAVAAINLKASIDSAYINVLINMGSIKDKEYVKECDERCKIILKNAEKLSSDILNAFTESVII